MKYELTSVCKFRARTWCCKLVGGCEIGFLTSSQLSPHKWMLRRLLMQIQNI